jgi:hypothetical protein
MKGYQPLIIYQLKTIFFSPIFSDGAAQISLVDPKNLTLSYVDVPTSEKDKFLTTDGIIDMISSYRDPSTRHMPVTIKGTDNKYYFMSLIYRDGNDVYMVRSARDMQQALVRLGKTFDIAKLSPITRAEMFYIATYYATYDKHVTVTRYPITSARSIYPSKVHLLSTIPSEEITFSLASNPEIKLTFPHFPIKDMPSVDSSSPHPAHLNNLGGDFDGDTASNNPVLSPEANDELTAHLNSPGSVVGVNGKLDVGISTDVAKLSFFNLSRDAVLV